MRNAGLEEAQTGIKIARRNINNLRYADDSTLMAENEEELKSKIIPMDNPSVLEHSEQTPCSSQVLRHLFAKLTMV